MKLTLGRIVPDKPLVAAHNSPLDKGLHYNKTGRLLERLVGGLVTPYPENCSIYFIHSSVNLKHKMGCILLRVEAKRLIEYFKFNFS